MPHAQQLQSRSDLAARIARAARRGRAVVVFASIRCPSCGSSETATGATLGAEIYGWCLACATRFTAIEARADELLSAVGKQIAEEFDNLPAEHSVADPVRDPDRVAAREALEGWRVRLSIERTRKRIDNGREPTDEDLELLERAAAFGDEAVGA